MPAKWESMKGVIGYTVRDNVRRLAWFPGAAVHRRGRRDLGTAILPRCAFGRVIVEIEEDGNKLGPVVSWRRVRRATPDQETCAASVAVVSLGIPKSLFL